MKPIFCVIYPILQRKISASKAAKKPKKEKVSRLIIHISSHLSTKRLTDKKSLSNFNNYIL